MNSQSPNLKSQISNLKPQLRPLHGQRRGIAIMAAVVALAILSLLMSAIAWQLLANRRMLLHREYQLQAENLARAGIEQAAADLLANSNEEFAKTLQLIPLSSVYVEVRVESDSPGVFRVTCEARYPTDAADYVTRSVTRLIKRQVQEGKIQLQMVNEME